ncbi:MAG: DNA polymerase IV [Candidatus Omnitrophica bacterium]|jgi:nucleotidyltransferase/DNA polymerase involved in DNA repair|nr:DNA polymerase IV [Candidatus Omnitrophota bacterium]
MKKNRFIVHVDMDAFFASVEQRDNPQYKGKPVIVGSDPKKGSGRGVVSTCSYEARKFGIHSAMPISIAYRKCPQAIFLPVDYQKYVQASNQIMKIFESFSPSVEQVSIDEAFLDISDTYKIHRFAYQTCVAIKKRIKEETGLTASVGLAPTKMAAKIASGLDKPDGLVQVKKENLLNFLWPLDVDMLWGVGSKTKTILDQMGIRTIGDLAQKEKGELVREFGKNGEWFWEMARGIDQSEVETDREAKSISNETTFEKDTNDKSAIISALASLCEQVSDRLREANFKCRTVTLKVRLEDFKTYTRSLTIPDSTNFSEVLIKTIRKLFEDFEVKNCKVRLVGVKASNLSCADEKYLFVDKEEVKKEKVHKAVDRIRQKFGSNSIYHASA